MKSTRGFTLIELLIVVAIISILSTIGITIYNNTQKGARDAKRKVDIDAITKVLETRYSIAAGSTYQGVDNNNFSSATTPVDPLNNQTSCQGQVCKYCSRSTIGNCTTSDEQVTGVGSPRYPNVGVTSWIVCANLENGTPSYFCRANQQ